MLRANNICLKKICTDSELFVRQSTVHIVVSIPKSRAVSQIVLRVIRNFLTIFVPFFWKFDFAREAYTSCRRYQSSVSATTTKSFRLFVSRPAFSACPSLPFPFLVKGTLGRMPIISGIPNGREQPPVRVGSRFHWIVFHTTLISSRTLTFCCPLYATSTLNLPCAQRFSLSCSSARGGLLNFCLSREEKCFSRVVCSIYSRKCFQVPCSLAIHLFEQYLECTMPAMASR